MQRNEAIYHEYFRSAFSQRKSLMRFALSYVRDAVVAEDIVMDSYMYCWQQRASLTFGSKNELLAYVLTAVKHKCLDYILQQKRRREILEQINSDALWDLNMSIQSLEALEPQSMYTDDRIALTQRLLATLPEKTRRIFLLSHHDGLTYREIAEREGLTVKAVEYHISKALRTMREHMNRLGPLAAVIFMFVD